MSTLLFETSIKSPCTSINNWIRARRFDGWVEENPQNGLVGRAENSDSSVILSDFPQLLRNLARRVFPPNFLFINIIKPSEWQAFKKKNIELPSYLLSYDTDQKK